MLDVVSILVMQRFRVAYHGKSHTSHLYFHDISTSLRGILHSMLCQEKAMQNDFIPYHRKYNGLHNLWHVRIALDWKSGCSTVQYTTSFLYSDWQYFPRHAIKTCIKRKERYFNFLQTAIADCGLFLTRDHLTNSTLKHFISIKTETWKKTESYRTIKICPYYV